MLGCALGTWCRPPKNWEHVTEAELPKLTDALQANGIAQTALHKHLLEQSPQIWWTHIEAMGDPSKLAQGLRAALDTTTISPAAAPPAQQPPVDIDTAGVDAALGRKGTADGGLFKYNLARGHHQREWACPAADLRCHDGDQLPARR
nr:DUF1259 domain-containing protein [Nocardia niigatensis]